MYVYSAPTSSYMYGIKNEGEATQEITLDLSGCDNMQVSTKSDGIMKKVLKGGEMQYYMHVMGGRGDFNKVIRHSAKEVKK